MSILAIDFGGTRMRAAWATPGADGAFTLQQRVEAPTQADDPQQQVIARLIALGRQAIPPGEQPQAVGIAAPGPHHAPSGLIYHSYTLPGWHDVPLGPLLAQAFDAPVFMQNDGNLGAVAEYTAGAGRGCNPMIYMTLSTGIGGGVMIDGRLFTGWSGLAAEPGHVLVLSPEGEMVRLEAIASGTAIGRRALPLALAAPAGAALHEAQHQGAAAVARAAAEGDAAAIGLLHTISQYLGSGLVTLLHLFSPEAIVIGGSVARMGELLLAPVSAFIDQHVLDPRFVPPRLIRPAHFGEDVCLIGAARWAQQQHSARPGGL